MKEIKNYINGTEHSISNKRLSVTDPSTGDQIANVVLSNEDDFSYLLSVFKIILSK